MCVYVEGIYRLLGSEYVGKLFHRPTANKCSPFSLTAIVSEISLKVTPGGLLRDLKTKPSHEVTGIGEIRLEASWRREPGGGREEGDRVSVFVA